MSRLDFAYGLSAQRWRIAPYSWPLCQRCLHRLFPATTDHRDGDGFARSVREEDLGEGGLRGDAVAPNCHDDVTLADAGPVAAPPDSTPWTSRRSPRPDHSAAASSGEIGT